MYFAMLGSARTTQGPRGARIGCGKTCIYTSIYTRIKANRNSDFSGTPPDGSSGPQRRGRDHGRSSRKEPSGPRAEKRRRLRPAGEQLGILRIICRPWLSASDHLKLARQPPPLALENHASSRGLGLVPRETGRLGPRHGLRLKWDISGEQGASRAAVRLALAPSDLRIG